MSKYKYRGYQLGGANVYYTCPNCGYDKVIFPTRPEVWQKYQADGILTLRQEVGEIVHIHCLTERDVFMPIALYLPACVLSGTLAMARAIPWQIFEGILVGGAMAVLMFAVRYRQGVAEPEQAPEPEITKLPEVTEVKRDNATGFDRFHKIDVRYPSGDPVPDYYLWKMAEAHVKRGVPFSRQMYVKKVVTRPAFEALRDRLFAIHWARAEGQDIILSPRAINLFREWVTLPCPTPPLS